MAEKQGRSQGGFRLLQKRSLRRMLPATIGLEAPPLFG
jgi:hypothetical protein